MRDVGIRRNGPHELQGFLMADGNTGREFQKARLALLACSNADRAFLRRWLLRWTTDTGKIQKDADLPDR